MSHQEFRRQAHEAVELIINYWETIERRPVLCPQKPGETLAALPMHPPETGEDWPDILADVQQIILPGLTHWQSPSFFAFFPANASYPAMLGELLCAGLGVQGMLWATSPACTELEVRVLDWLAELIELPSAFRSGGSENGAGGGGGGGGVIQGTASEATLVTMLAAQQRRRQAGHIGPMPIYTSTQAHSSVIKAAMIAGLATHPDDRANVRLIGTDDTYRLRADLLASALATDVQSGRGPGYVCATIGTTSSTAIDPLPELGAKLSVLGENRPWLHVDAAFSGASCLCPEFRWQLDGVEHADSVCFNPHKWLLTNFDCSCLWTRDRAALVGGLSVTPEYLRNPASASGSVIDYRDWQIPLGRRMRSLKLWLVLRHYGRSGLQAYIREHVALAQEFEAWLSRDARFELLAPRTTSLVCFRLRPLPDELPADTDARNQRLLAQLNATGQVYLSHTNLPTIGLDGTPGTSRYTLRLAIGAAQTQRRHVAAAWALIQQLAEA